MTALQALPPDELCLSSVGLVLRGAQPTWGDGVRSGEGSRAMGSAGLRMADCISGRARWVGGEKPLRYWSVGHERGTHTHTLQELEFWQSFLTQKSETKSQLHGIPSQSLPNLSFQDIL